MKWIVAIRKDIGKHFQVTTHTRVCSRHFKPSDYLPSLTGRKSTLKPAAVPPVFHWPEEEIPSKMEGANKKKSNQKEKGHRNQRATPRAKYFWSHRKLRFSRQSKKIWKTLQ